MIYYLYSSFCVGKAFQSADIDIFRSGLKNNGRLGISGYLLRTRSYYFQYIEGHPDPVRKLISKLKADPRHFGMHTHMYGERRVPRLSGWSMGYSQMTADNPILDAITPAASNESIMNYLFSEAERQSKKLMHDGSSTYVSLRNGNPTGGFAIDQHENIFRLEA